MYLVWKRGNTPCQLCLECVYMVSLALMVKVVFYFSADRNSLLNMLNQVISETRHPLQLFRVFSQIDLTYFVKYIFIWHEENRHGRTSNLSDFLCATFWLLKHWKSVTLGNKLLNFYENFNVCCMNNTLLEMQLLHKDIFWHLLQLCYGSTVIEMESVHSCLPSSTNLIWIENGYLISFEQTTGTPCSLLGTTIKPAGSRLTNQFRGFCQI